MFLLFLCGFAFCVCVFVGLCLGFVRLCFYVVVFLCRCVFVFSACVCVFLFVFLRCLVFLCFLLFAFAYSCLFLCGCVFVAIVTDSWPPTPDRSKLMFNSSCCSLKVVFVQKVPGVKGAWCKKGSMDCDINTSKYLCLGFLGYPPSRFVFFSVSFFRPLICVWSQPGSSYIIPANYECLKAGAQYSWYDTFEDFRYCDGPEWYIPSAYWNDGYCDCPSCEDESGTWTCNTCGGCPGTCGDSFLCHPSASHDKLCPLPPGVLSNGTFTCDNGWKIPADRKEDGEYCDCPNCEDEGHLDLLGFVYCSLFNLFARWQDGVNPTWMTFVLVHHTLFLIFVFLWRVLDLALNWPWTKWRSKDAPLTPHTPWLLNAAN